MRLGFASMNTPEELSPAVLGRALEERGFDSLFAGEHSHIPASRKTPYPVGGDLPDAYVRMMDPYVSLMDAAAATSSLLIGTGVALPLERDLFELAKTVATIDRLSGGRFCFGVGVGWNEEELADHRPIPWVRRYRALAECVQALRALWCDDESEFHGEFYDFGPVWSYPKPVCQPHSPVLCGMAGKLGVRHAVEWADGWMPMDIALGDVAKKITKFREAEAVAGRSPMPITLLAWGDPSAETLLGYRDLGVERVVLGAGRAGWHDARTTMPFVDHYAGFVEALL